MGGGGLSYPTHFLKSRDSVIRNNFLGSRSKEVILLRDEMNFMHCLLQIKQNIYSIGIFGAPVVTQFIVKVLRKLKKVPCLKVYHFSVSQHFSNVKV